MAKDLAKARKWRREHREQLCENNRRFRARHPNVHLFHKYGLTNEQYQAMLKRQENKCGICGRPFVFTPRNNQPRSPAVDHDHQTGIVRGIVCRKCNLGMGYFDDSIDTLQRVLAYLTEGR